MNPKIIKGIGILGTLLGGLATLISSWSEKQEREAETREVAERVVKEEMQKYLSDAETIVETEEESH